MPAGFPNLKDGDLLQPWMINVIYRELERWRKTDAAAPLGVDYADDAYSPPFIHLDSSDELVPVLTGSGGVTAGSYSSPTLNTVTLLDDNNGGPDLAALSGSDTETMYNISGTSFSGSKICWAKRRANGFLYFVVGDC